MAEPTIVLFGTVDHPALTLLYHYLQERGRRRVVYLSNELFPRQPQFDLELADDFESVRFLFPDQPPVEFEDVVSVGLDGYYVNPPGLESYSERDKEYLQTESWAALIAIFAALARRVPVANHVLRREDLGSRLAMLAYLQSAGAPVPNTCVTSDPDAARDFVREHGGRVIHRPVSVRELPVQAWSPDHESRLDRLPLCPVHFEEQIQGPLGSATRVGDRWVLDPVDLVLPEATLAGLQRAADGLGLHLAEFALRRRGEDWVCTSLYPFLRPRHLADVATAETVAEFFEQ